MNEKELKVRLLVGAVIMMLALTGLGTRLVFLHLGPHEAIRSGVARIRKVEKTLTPGRGHIFDCRGQGSLLAINRCLQDLCADPSTLAKSNRVQAVAQWLGETLGLPADDLALRLDRPDRRFACLRKSVPDEQVKLIQDQKIPGVFFQESVTRHYPGHNLMCHVVGFVNYEGQGSAGVEQFYNRFLRGSPGFLETQVDGLRRELYWEREKYQPAVAGADVHLNLDQNVQYIVEKALDGVMADHNAKGAWAIVQRVRTGEILAMASRPAYDLNKFPTADQDSLLNRAIGIVYEPGSTFKAIAISAAFNDATVTADTVFDCENGSWMFRKRLLRDYHPYGRLTVADGLKKSSNILTAKVALTLGEERFHKYLRAYGIGSKMGLDLPGEENGILHPVSKWSGISITRIAIGQGVAVTALQMLGVYSAIANDGFLMRPYVANRVCRADGTLMHEPRPEVIGRPISVETAALMRHLLSRVTEEGGTGTRAQVEGFDVAGKTGSAQKPMAGGYSSTAYMASFVGFLPAEDPELALIVVVDEPQPYHTGGVVAGPVFSRIANEAVRYLDIPPTSIEVAQRDR